MFKLFLIVVSLLLLETQSVPFFRNEYSNYLGIIDAGSTGSRFYLFHAMRNSDNEITKMVEIYTDECQPGINSYKDNLDEVWAPLYKMIKGSEKVFSSKGMNVPLYIYATAGMRVLSASDQKAIYNSIFTHYFRSDTSFYMTRDMLQTIDGEKEAMYGWITVNVLNNRITPSLKYNGLETIGSLDLGGESTQIAYQYKPSVGGQDVNFQTDIFSKSFLSFGAKEMQFRYENYILSNREVLRDERGNRENKLHVPNPCNNEGLIGSTSLYEDLYHEGTGNLDKCESILAHLLQGDTPCNDTFEKKCSIWSLLIPKIHSNFIGMSLYFFVIDFVKSIYNLDEDYQPSIDELKSYGKVFCAMKWKFRDVLSSYSGKHKYTSDEVLKQRCFQISYIVTLLESGYRLNEIVEGTTIKADKPVSIEYRRTINGESVDWTYGAALYMGRKPVPKRINPIWLWIVLFVSIVFLFLVVITSRNIRIRYSKVSIV